MLQILQQRNYKFGKKKHDGFIDICLVPKVSFA